MHIAPSSKRSRRTSSYVSRHQLLIRFAQLLVCLFIINLAAHFILSFHMSDDKVKPPPPYHPSADIIGRWTNGSHATRRPKPSNNATMPLWWLAPFFDHTSFGKEASTIILGGLRSGSLKEEEVMLETTQGECNYKVDESMPYRDFYELDQAVWRGRSHMDHFIMNHGISNEDKDKLVKQNHRGGPEASWQKEHRAIQLVHLMKQFEQAKEVLIDKSVIGISKEAVQETAIKASSSSLPPRVLDKGFNSTGQRSDGAIVVCHSLPPFWARPLHHWRTCAPCPPIGYIPAYAIGRAMAETDVYNAEFVKSCNTMDEIWVPSKFSLDVLRESGVTVPMRIVPIAVNTTLFDPSSTSQLRHLPIGDLVIGQHRRLSLTVMIRRDSDDVPKQMKDLRVKILALEEDIEAIELRKTMVVVLKHQVRFISSDKDEIKKMTDAQHLKNTVKPSAKMKNEDVDLEARKTALLKEKEAMVMTLEEIDPSKFDDEKPLKTHRPSALLRILNNLGPPPVDQKIASLPSPVSDHPPPHRRLKPFCFISTFKWEERKGWKQLLSAYLQEFSSEDDVELFIITKPFSNLETTIQATVKTFAERELKIRMKKNLSSPWWDDSDDAEPPQAWFGSRRNPDPPHRKTSSSSPSLYIISNHLSNEDYSQMFKSCQAYVSPSRGEGWGMPVTEAMSMGLPVIVTNWSGLVDFVDDHVGRLLNYTLEVIPRSKSVPWWFWDARWAEVDVDDLRRAMRDAYEQPELTREKGMAARERMVTLYSPEAVSKIVADELERIRVGIKSGLIEGYRSEHVLGPHDSRSELDGIYSEQETFSIPEAGRGGLVECKVCMFIIVAVVLFDLALVLVVFSALVGSVWMERGGADLRAELRARRGRADMDHEEA